MSVTIRMTGGKELAAALHSMSLDVQDEVSKAVVGTAVELRKDVVKGIQSGPASGRTYQKYNPRRTHTASAPGQAPMSDTGRLASSVEFDQRGRFTATVGSKLAYALYLEYGTSRVAARPFFRPAVERMKLKFLRRIEKAVRRATQ